MSNQATGVSAIAERYATAVFDLAEERGALDAVADDLVGLAGLLDESAELGRLVASPVLARDQQRAAMDAVLSEAGCGEITRNLVGLLAGNRRLFLLGEVIAAFRRRLADSRGEVSARVVAARKLSDEQRETLTRTLREAVGGKVVVEEEVDGSLLGGIVVRIGSRMIDGSLRNKLEGLKLAMKGTS